MGTERSPVEYHIRTCIFQKKTSTLLWKRMCNCEFCFHLFWEMSDFVLYFHFQWKTALLLWLCSFYGFRQPLIILGNIILIRSISKVSIYCILPPKVGNVLLKVKLERN